ncbi:MAG: cell division protein ZapD [Betaproteobacteria bacterium]|nr:cell division protein ZapD [Betaproteobacteria bacterium]
MITYEYPFNERTRTLLRLEDLFEKVAYFMRKEEAYEHHVALTTLFEILEISGRSDFKMDLIHELERQRQTLQAFRNNPEISEEVLSRALAEIEQASAALLTLSGKIGQQLKENEWLMGIKNRAGIPGGVCEFDLPSYHYWLHRPVEMRQAALSSWLQSLNPLWSTLSIILRLLRASGNTETYIAKKGAFQLVLGGSSTAQMVRIFLAPEIPYIPEISANRYAFNIRFTTSDSSLRSRPCDADVGFEMTFCAL